MSLCASGILTYFGSSLLFSATWSGLSASFFSSGALPVTVFRVLCSLLCACCAFTRAMRFFTRSS